MTTPPVAVLRVAVVGGDGRHGDVNLPGVQTRSFPSRRDGGRRGQGSILSAIRLGAIDVVLVLVRFMGHSDSAALKAACRTAGVPCRMVGGGSSCVERAVREEADRAR